MCPKLPFPQSSFSFKNIFLILILALGVSGGVAFMLGGFAEGGGILALFWTPLPKLDDVNSETYERMKEMVGRSRENGVGFVAALSKEDMLNPSFYVATNLPEGTMINFKLEAIPGKIVNKVFLKVEEKRPVEGNSMAKFGPLGDGAKPLPMGSYKVIVTSDASPSEKLIDVVTIGAKVVIERRMGRYLERLQKDYDREVGELREIIRTLVNVHREFKEKIVVTKRNRSRQNLEQLLSLWDGFVGQKKALLLQIETKITPNLKKKTEREIFYPVFYQRSQDFIDTLRAELVYTSAKISSKAPKIQEPKRIKRLQVLNDGLASFLGESIKDKPIKILLNIHRNGPENSWPEKFKVPDAPGVKPAPKPIKSEPKKSVPAAKGKDPKAKLATGAKLATPAKGAKPATPAKGTKKAPTAPPKTAKDLGLSPEELKELESLEVQ